MWRLSEEVRKMNDLLEEYLFEYEIFLADREVNERLFQLECGYLNETTGLISLNEALIDTLKEWFDKICNAIVSVIQKLETKLNDIYNKQLGKYADVINDPGRLDPATLQVPITNYHDYDFTKFRDGTFDAKKSFTNPEFMNTVAGLVGGGTGQAPERVSNQDILKAVYPQLYDEKLSIFDKMREAILITGKDNNEQTMLDGEMLDKAWKYVSEEYKGLIQKIKEDKDAVTTQKKAVDSAAQQLLNVVQAQNAPNPTQESFVFCEGYLLEADEKDKDIKTQTIGGPEGEKAVSKETYVKALMSYIQVATNIISAKAKIVNSAYIDKSKIITYYCKRAK